MVIFWDVWFDFIQQCLQVTTYLIDYSRCRGGHIIFCIFYCISNKVTYRTYIPWFFNPKIMRTASSGYIQFGEITEIYLCITVSVLSLYVCEST